MDYPSGVAVSLMTL